MTKHNPKTIAVIFVSQRLPDQAAEYSAVASAMDALASAQPGYCGVDSVRDADGLGITVSYWADEAAAAAWRDHPDHTEIREAGRGRWYRDYSVHVAAIQRSYDWERSNE